MRAKEGRKKKGGGREDGAASDSSRYAHRVPHTSSSRFTSVEEDLESSPRELPQR